MACGLRTRRHSLPAGSNSSSDRDHHLVPLTHSTSFCFIRELAERTVIPSMLQPDFSLESRERFRYSGGEIGMFRSG